MSGKLSPAEITAALAGLPGWSSRDGALSRAWRFGDFPGAIGFVNRVAAAAEEMGHHPDIDIRYNEVSLRLWTHSEGGVTSRDLELAARIDAL